MGVEVVQVPLAGAFVRRSRCCPPGRGTRPCRRCPAAGRRARRSSRGSGLSLLRRAALNHGCWSEVWLTTRSAITRMPAVVGGPDELDEVAVRAEPAVDAVQVGDVVAVVAVGRRVEGHQPQAGDAELGEVVDALGQAGEVADAVAVGVQVGLDVQAVDDGVLPPQVAACSRPAPRLRPPLERRAGRARRRRR